MEDLGVSVWSLFFLMPKAIIDSGHFTGGAGESYAGKANLSGYIVGQARRL